MHSPVFMKLARMQGCWFLENVSGIFSHTSSAQLVDFASNMINHPQSPQKVFRLPVVLRVSQQQRPWVLKALLKRRGRMARSVNSIQFQTKVKANSRHSSCFLLCLSLGCRAPFKVGMIGLNPKCDVKPAISLARRIQREQLRVSFWPSNRVVRQKPAEWGVWKKRPLFYHALIERIKNKLR